MATSAPAPQLLDASATTSSYQAPAPQYYASYAQGYHQASGYPYASWPTQQSGYEATHTYPAQPAELPTPGADLQPGVADNSSTQQAQHDLSNAYYSSQQYHDWWNHYVQYYGQYPPDQPAPQYGYAAAAPQISPAPWAPAASLQPAVLPAPAQQAPPTMAIQQPAVQRPVAQQHTRPKAKTPAMPGYMSMPDGSFKVVPKEGRPAYIAPNVPKKKAGVAADARPAFIQVQDTKPESKEAAAMPAALTRFVQACFTAADATVDKAAMMARVKKMITDSQAKGEMWTRDWDNVPLPITKLGAPQDALSSPPLPANGRPSKWGQKPVALKPPAAAVPPSPSTSLTSRSTRRSYSTDSSLSSRSRSRTRSRSPSSSTSRSRSSSRSPDSRRKRGRRAGKRHRPPVSIRGSPGDWQGRAKKFKQAGPPETKKQRKQRMAQERRAAQESAATQKKAKAQNNIVVDESHVPTAEELRRRQMRAGRFGKGAVDHAVPMRAQTPVYAAELARGDNTMSAGDSEADWDKHAVQGSCLNLEKKYFRLTGPPDPRAVRPPHVLKAALDRVVKLYRAGKCDIHYAEDQLKAIRQDVTVQHVRGALPVQIYEAHARACLEHGNGGDFNQCQTQLKVLYKEGAPGCVEEFVAYRVLYQSILRTRESASLLATLETLTPQVCAHPAVAHALKVRQALVFARFPHFFKLYATAPNLGRALMDMCFSRVRFAALETVVDAFKATKVKVLYVASVLGFLVKPEGEGALPAVVSEDTAVDLDLHSSDGGLMLPGCAKTIHLGKHPAQTDAERAATNTIHWLQSCNAYVILETGAQPSSALLDCKLSTGLRMPEDLAAVAHGDATLNLDNFMHQVRV